MKIIMLDNYTTRQYSNFKSSQKSDKWEEPISDTIKTAVTLGMFLNLDYFTTLKGDKKITKTGKILMLSGVIGSFVYDIVKSFKKEK